MTQTCFTLKGEISGRIERSNVISTQTLCWIIEVPEDLYVTLNIRQLYFQSRPCSDTYLTILVTGTKQSSTFCAGETYNKPMTASSDVKVTFSHKQNGNNYYSFRLDYQLDHPVCREKDHFRCSDTLCIHQYQVCNGIKDCKNGSDEVGCGKGHLAIKGMDVSRENAISWLMNQQSSTYDWGKNTHRAITALYLAGATNFTGKNLEEELTVKQLELQTSVALLRNSTDPISVSELSMFVNALTVTCHNPRQFYGHDLLQILGDRVTTVSSSNPSAYLTLCNANWEFTESDVERIMKPLQEHSKYPFTSDVQAVAVMALRCMKSTSQYFRNTAFPERPYEKAIKKFMAGQLSDGSFGNVYTTALVTQALILSGYQHNKDWNITAAAHYLMKQLNSSSVDFLSAYLTLPFFNGRSLVDIASVNCSNSARKQGGDNEISDIMNKLGRKRDIQYSLFVGDRKDIVHKIVLKMPENSTAYDVMRVAQVADPKYKFLHRDVSGQMYVYEIAGITNDPEAGKFWLLHKEDSSDIGIVTHYLESPDKVFMGENENLIMWYKTADI